MSPLFVFYARRALIERSLERFFHTAFARVALEWTSRQLSSDPASTNTPFPTTGDPGVDTAQPPPRTHLFTVRLWLEDLGQGQKEWRGEVHEVVSGERRYFRDWPTLVALLQAGLPKTDNAGVPVVRDPSQFTSEADGR